MATEKAVKHSDKLAWRFEAPAKIVPYRESDSKYVGDEPQYPDVEKQRAWQGIFRCRGSGKDRTTGFMGRCGSGATLGLSPSEEVIRQSVRSP